MMSKNQILIILLLTMTSQIICGQSIVRSSLSCLGSTATDNGLLLRQTIGQPANTVVFNNNGLVLRQGFQQPIALYSLKDVVLPLDFTLSPNPAVDKTLLQFHREISQVTITIRNINGIVIGKIQEKSLQTKWLSLKSYPPGVYVVSATYDNQSGSKKLIITH